MKVEATKPIRSSCGERTWFRSSALSTQDQVRWWHMSPSQWVQCHWILDPILTRGERQSLKSEMHAVWKNFNQKNPSSLKHIVGVTSKYEYISTINFNFNSEFFLGVEVNSSSVFFSLGCINWFFTSLTNHLCYLLNTLLHTHGDLLFVVINKKLIELHNC